MKKNTKRKINKTNLVAIIVAVIAALGLICLVAGLAVIMYMLKDKPEFNITDFNNQESSIVYDRNGNQIAELGSTIRENVSYNEIPNTVVDAFVAIEDSRFFVHNGFDLPRFAKAFISNLRTMSFGQGGSTFSMQLVKNTYFVDDDAGINAPKKISRKVREIALAIELEQATNKKTIFEYYINKINFGGDRNIRGIEKAAEYYFDKSVSELNLSESALLAGIVNAPNAYNPFYHLEAATNRRNTVLYQMLYHGYITEEEYELAKSIKVENLLADPYKKENQGEGLGTPYQAYIDVVVDEVYQLTGMDPYSTTMKIYTCMDKEVQTVMDDIQAGNVNGYFEFPDDEFEIASISVNNKTGEINAVLGGRNYADGGALLLNHATSQYKQPGSSIKPILDYALAFEKLGWSTSHVVVDKPVTYPGTSIIVSNSDNSYNGQMTLKNAVGVSKNTPAIQALQDVIDATSNAYVVDYMNSMGFNISLDTFNIQYAIGGSDISVSCLQMAGAQAAIMNYGSYITPHTVSRIEFTNGKNPITPTYTPVQNLTEAAAFLTTELLYSNVYGGYANLMQILQDDYAVYAKTGTTDWGTSGRPYNIPDGSIKDSWVIASSSDFTTATWIGYEKASVDKQSYITLDAYLTNIQGKTANLILDKNTEVYGTPEKITRPNGVSGITHILATYPYAAPIDGMDEKYITSGYIKSEYATLVSPEKLDVSEIKDEEPLSASILEQNKIVITWPTYPDESKLSVASDTMDISLKYSDGSVAYECYGARLFDYTWVYGAIRYKADIKNANGEVIMHIVSESPTYTYEANLEPGQTYSVDIYYGYETKDVNSNIITKQLTASDQITFTIPGPGLSKEQIQEWISANYLNGKVTLTEEKTGDHNKNNTYEFKDVNDPTKTYSSGQVVTMKYSDVNIKCIYYVYNGVNPDEETH